MSNPGQGQADLSVDTSEFNKISFLISQALALVAGAALVRVVSCSVNDEVGPVGFVDVQPLVNMIDGAGVSQQHGVISKLPFSRVCAGGNALICDPQKDDIGLAVFADRDISAVKSSQNISNPGSFRRNSMSDGIYLFTVLSKTTPVQWIRFVRDGDGVPTGIEIVDKSNNRFVMQAAGFSLTDVHSNTIITDNDGIHLNGVLIDRSRNVSNIVDLTNSGNSNLSGASQAVKLADGSNATKVKGT